MPAPISVTARAKLNLSLHVTGKRHDGYHLLESFIVFTEFGDRLQFEPAKTLSLSVTGPFAEGLGVEHNLVMDAAKLLAESSGHTGGARITLEKNIPVGAGLGGGSCDAGATLKALAKLWNLPNARMEALQYIGLMLGADVPACVQDEPVWVRGVGDYIGAIKLNAEVHVLLVNPNKPLLTADVFRRYGGQFSASVQAPEAIDSFGALIDCLLPLHNDLEAPAMALMPDIAAILAATRAQPGCALARMSGSGATCFGLFAQEEETAAARNALAKIHPNWWSVATKL